MKIQIKMLYSTLIAVFALWLAGCSDKEVAPEQNEDINLTDNFGGYKATNEQPAFGDPEIASLEGSDEADDPMVGTSEVDSIMHLLDVDVYSAEFLWGNLELDSSETVVTDWSGSITVERGAIIAVRLIRFDAGDYIIRPRLLRSKLDFVSKTQPSFDGLLVYVYDPKPADFDTENALTFESGPYTRTLTMSELADISEIVDVGDNQFSINAFKVERLECGEGFFEGKWVRPSSERGRGSFVGRWISQDGLMLGHVQGHFGTRDDGTQVIFGKWISVAGLFRGFLRGEWGIGTIEDPAATNMGWTEGDIYDRDEVVIGEFSANWVARQRNGNQNEHAAKHGFFRGQWSQICE